MANPTDLNNIALPLIFMGGLLGSSHCVGMCGGFVLGIGLNTNHWRANLSKQLTYSIGRIATYTLLGSISGYAGLWADRRWHHFLNVQASLSLVAGFVLVVQGLWHLGFLEFKVLRRFTSGPLAAPVCHAARQFGSLIRSPGIGPAFVAGVLTGFMPCGLVYANLGLAAGSASLWKGALNMAVFGLGTLPLMLVAGMGAGVASPQLRGRVMKLAAICLFLTGCVTLSRAYAGYLAENHDGRIQADCAACVVIPQPESNSPVASKVIE